MQKMCDVLSKRCHSGRIKLKIRNYGLYRKVIIGIIISYSSVYIFLTFKIKECNINIQ